MVNDTGESFASINARMDAEQMPHVMEQLRNGAVLWQPKSGFNYYIRISGDYGDKGFLTPSGVRKLEKNGVLELVGVKTYALKEKCE